VTTGNAEIVKAAFAAYDRGDIDEVLRLCHEDIEVVQAEEVPGVTGRQHGHAGVLEAFALWPEQWDDFRIEILDIRELGEHVVVTTRQRGRGRGSGVEVETEFTFLLLVRDGRFAQWRIFMREADALEAIGRSGEAP
jgi:ketosteroid isomerase-like protein